MAVGFVLFSVVLWFGLVWLGLDLVDLFDLDARLVCDLWLIVDLVACCIVWFIVRWVTWVGWLVVDFDLVGAALDWWGLLMVTAWLWFLALFSCVFWMFGWWVSGFRSGLCCAMGFRFALV